MDVELTCNGCGGQTLTTDGCWSPKCSSCGGRRVVTKRYDHVLSWKEAEAAGFRIVNALSPAQGSP